MSDKERLRELEQDYKKVNDTYYIELCNLQAYMENKALDNEEVLKYCKDKRKYIASLDTKANLILDEIYKLKFKTIVKTSIESTKSPKKIA